MSYDLGPGIRRDERWKRVLSAIKKGYPASAPSLSAWWKHLRWTNRAFWKHQRQADKQEALDQRQDS